jgi:putative addiction module antidote
MHTFKIQKIEIQRIGDSLGVVLPEEILQKLKVAEGDSVLVKETPDGIELTPYDSDLVEEMQIFAEVRKQYRNAFRELAQ